MNAIKLMKYSASAFAFAALTTVSANAGEDIFCSQYADTAVAQNKQQNAYNCGYEPPVWSNDRDGHFNWCMRVSQADAETGNRMRLDGLKTCLPLEVSAFGANEDCAIYANQAVNQQKENLSKSCGFTGPAWKADALYHYNWCARVDKDSADQGADLRRRALATCEMPASANVSIVSSETRKITLSRPALAFGEDTLAIDKDRDGVVDRAENEIANAFRPYLVFDSAEQHRQDDMPLVLFQVIPKSSVPGAQKLRLRYALVFRGDTYGPDAGYGCDWGSGSHNGDIETMTFEVTGDGAAQTWTLTKVEVAPWRPGPSWPGTNLEIRGKTHPVVYLSASKHHQYLDTSRDHDDSIYSDPPWPFDECNDDVNGRGAVVLADLQSLGHGNAYGFNNVGEIADHDDTYFVSDLSPFFSDHEVWSGKKLYDVGPISKVFYGPDNQKPTYIPLPQTPGMMEGEAIIIKPDKPLTPPEMAVPDRSIRAGTLGTIDPGQVFAIGTTQVHSARIGMLENNRLPITIDYTLDNQAFLQGAMTAGAWLLGEDGEIIDSIGYMPTIITSPGSGSITVPLILEGDAIQVAGVRAFINRYTTQVSSADFEARMTWSGE